MVSREQPNNDDVASNDTPDAAPASTQQSHPSSSSPPWPIITPASALLISSLPLGIGTYIGYRRALHSSNSTPASSSSSASALSGGLFGTRGNNSILGQIIHHPEITSSGSSRLSTPKIAVSSTPPPVLAARALALGSLLSVSATTLLLSGIFYASGCHSVDDLISTWRSWAPKKLHGIETAIESTLGISVGKERRSAKMEYERATEGMTEDEEIEYVRNKYGGEIQWDDDSDDGRGDANAKKTNDVEKQ